MLTSIHQGGSWEVAVAWGRGAPQFSLPQEGAPCGRAQGQDPIAKVSEPELPARLLTLSVPPQNPGLPASVEPWLPTACRPAPTAELSRWSTGLQQEGKVPQRPHAGVDRRLRPGPGATSPVLSCHCLQEAQRVPSAEAPLQAARAGPVRYL